MQIAPASLKLLPVGNRPAFSRFLLCLLKVGLTAYGGPAIVAQLHQELVRRQKWVTEEEFAESLAFAQLIPGPVVPATAAHVAQRLYGPLAVFPAVCAYAVPAFALMLALSALYFRWGKLPAVSASFRALGPVIVGIVASATLQLAQPALRDFRGLFLAGALLPLFSVRINPVIVVLLGAVLGLVIFSSEDGTGSMPRLPKGSRRRALAWGSLAGATLLFLLAGLALRHPPLASFALKVAKISLMAFGGGYTAVALMFHAFVKAEPPLLPTKEFVDGLALGQLTPGPVIITATFVGYKVAGILGAVVATLYTFLPPAALVTMLAPHVAQLRKSLWFGRAVRGALAAFVALLLHVLAVVASGTLVEPWAGPVALVSFASLAAGAPVLALVALAVISGLLALI